MEKFKQLIEAVNSISPNVWAMIVIAAGVVLCFTKQGPMAGAPLLTLGGGIFQHTLNK